MFERFETQPGTPAEIESFERFMMGSLLVGGGVASLMYPDMVKEMGTWIASLLVSGWLLGTMGLTIMISRKRSNLARWLFVVESAIALLPYAVYVGIMFDEFPVGHASVIQLGLQAFALYKLFTPPARAWFHGRDYRQHRDPDS